MGFFSSNKYSQTEYQLSELEVRRCITNINVPTLVGDPNSEKLVQDAVLARRRGDGKISLQQIYEVLNHLKSAKQISQYDRNGVIKVMQNLFQSKGM